MHDRCENEHHPAYPNYGGRGITVCDEWSMANADVFIAWAMKHGYQEGLEIDRIDNDKGYAPDNCRFVSKQENCRNRRSNRKVVINNEEMLLCEAVERFSVVSKQEFERRYYHRKWPLEKALFQIPRPYHKKKERIE
jgi:hypothetical protein